MKRIFVVLIVLALTLSFSLAYSVPDNTRVYVTPTGTKYHRDGCTYTAEDTVKSMTIKRAEKEGYTACSRCRPDIYTGEYVSSWDSEMVWTGHSSAAAEPDPDPTPDKVTQEPAAKAGLPEWAGALAALLIYPAALFLVWAIAKAAEKLKKLRVR